MTSADFWMLIVVVVLSICVHSVRLISNDRTSSQRKSSIGADQDENYIITHYGKEYYTPAKTADIQVHKDGYFTAEVIPVDVNTGDELKTVQNLFVPMHTGYSIAVDYDGSNRKLTANRRTPGLIFNERLQGEASRNVDHKSKLPKKFKPKYGSNAKKSNEEHAVVPPLHSSAGAMEASLTTKIVPKRHVSAHPAEFHRGYRYFNIVGDRRNNNRRNDRYFK